MGTMPVEENNDLYVIQEEQQETEKPDPIAKTLELIATTQAQQAKAFEALANKANTPVNVYTQPQTQTVQNDPIQTMQNEINGIVSQLDQMRANGDIDDSEYWIKHQSLVAPKKEALRDLKYRSEIDATKSELSKTYEEKLAEQKKVLDEIQSQNYAKTEQEKIRMITNKFPDASNKDSALFKEMENLFQNPVLGILYKDAATDKDHYLALATQAAENLRARGIQSNQRTNQAVNQYGVQGNPSVYQNNGIQTTFRQEDIDGLKHLLGDSLTNDTLIKLSDYNNEAQAGRSITLRDWIPRNA